MMKHLIRWNIVESMLKFFLQVNDLIKWNSNGFLFFFFFSKKYRGGIYLYSVELCEFYSVFQLFFVEILQLINIRTF